MPNSSLKNFAISGDRLAIVQQQFARSGLNQVDALSRNWDVLWTLTFPFGGLLDTDLQPHQRVNHFPLSPFVNKSWLASCEFDFLPRSYLVPGAPTRGDAESDLLERFAQSYVNEPDTYWLRKNTTHRGIVISSPLDALQHTLSNDESFLIQEMIHPPHTIFGHKWDLGLYVALTSLDPLEIFIYDDVALRFCPQPYPRELDPELTDAYVIAANYLPPWELQPFVELCGQNKTSMQMLDAYFIEHENIPWRETILPQCQNAIYQVIAQNKHEMLATADQFPSGQAHFFELFRFDFICSDLGKAYMLESNFSPNLSAAANKPLEHLFSGLLDDLFELVGCTSRESPVLDTNRLPSSNGWQRLVAEDKKDAQSVRGAKVVPHKIAPSYEASQSVNTRELRGSLFGVTFSIEYDDQLLETEIRTRLPRFSPAGGTPALLRYRITENLDVYVGDKLLQRNGSTYAAISALRTALDYDLTLQTQDYLFIRAAVVNFMGRNVLFPGVQGSGKSTLALACVAAGAIYSSDTFAVIGRDGLVQPYPCAITIYDATGRRQDLVVEELGLPIAEQAGAIDQVIFTEYDLTATEQGPGELLEEIGVEQGISMLRKCCFPAEEEKGGLWQALEQEAKSWEFLLGPRSEVDVFVAQVLGFQGG